jgi:hypothetical protein
MLILFTVNAQVATPLPVQVQIFDVKGKLLKNEILFLSFGYRGMCRYIKAFDHNSFNWSLHIA